MTGEPIAKEPIDALRCLLMREVADAFKALDPDLA
tara:strand:- start:362 stop:466 length:105 start_codon:yes stop_codon:yes gene_type:complete